MHFRPLRKLLPVLLLAAACSGPVPSGRAALPLVMDIASGRATAERGVIDSRQGPLSAGDIYIAGSPAACRLLCADFLDCDVFDNVRGRSFSDDLKDFAGETFACIEDDVFSPYGELISAGDTATLRELAVRYALAALDDKCNVSQFDLDGNAAKTPAKLLILADPWMHEYGMFDVDTLFSLTSCPVNLVSPQSLMMDEVLGGSQKSFNIGIICDSIYVGKGIYPAIFRSKCRQFDIVGARCFEASVSGREGSLYEFLDKYIASGRSEALDAILVDDRALQYGAVESEILAARDLNREESMNYGKLIAPGLRVVRSSDLTMRWCYEVLRSGDLFTHKIALPQASFYSVRKNPVEGGAHFLLIPASNVQD